ncbi:hypothetical protein H9Y04_09220 [Streptomyces sp. TRM66268-LWL]|uniref:Uncharacterized protein n=1 Tax=Streptomyces polyasparticus TaxID=2767826 RepID=A0ABR7SDS9_9ACTN|nr:hypothetical protein [Streptomyces polyasparticus]
MSRPRTWVCRAGARAIKDPSGPRNVLVPGRLEMVVGLGAEDLRYLMERDELPVQGPAVELGRCRGLGEPGRRDELVQGPRRQERTPERSRSLSR